MQPPQGVGPSTTIDNRFNRWSRRRLWIGLLEALAGVGAVTKSTAIDSTYVKAQRCACGGTPSGRKFRRSVPRGGQRTNVHALTDTIGRPFALSLTPGTASDITAAPALLAHAAS